MTINHLAKHSASGAAQSDNAADQAASTLKAAGDSLRLKILSVLSSDSFGVLELCQIFGTKQSGMSHHLKVLARAGFVSTRREGNTIFYRRNDSSLGAELEKLRQSVYDIAEYLPLEASEEQNLGAVYQQRSEASRAFFRNNSHAFKKQRELIAHFEVYGPEVGRLLEVSDFPNRQCALEIGPGMGEFLNHLSKKFEQVTALDNSESMLMKSRRHCETQNLENIEFICGDTSFCQTQENKYDCAVINMVLHHTASPTHIFQDVAHSLRKGAVLLVSDLGAHNQDWVREACGDQWLGFNTEELKAWAFKAKLVLGESRYLSLRNGFQIQIHQFIKN